MQVEVRAILVGARAKASPSLLSIRGRRGYLCTDRAALQDEASLYGGRQRSNFSAQAQRCERAGEVSTPFEIHRLASLEVDWRG